MLNINFYLDFSIECEAKVFVIVIVQIAHLCHKCSNLFVLQTIFQSSRTSYTRTKLQHIAILTLQLISIPRDIGTRAHEPTNEARAEPSLLELCLARRRKTEG